MIENIKFIDSHVHLDIIYKYKPENIPWLREKGCLPVSWAYSVEINSAKDIADYLEEQKKAIHALNERGISCYYLAGIHPRNIADDLKPEDIPGLILPSLGDPLCRGIGEIGLETGSAREKEVLSAHLELSEEVAGRGKVLGIHTPMNDKLRVTKELFPLLEKFSRWKESIVVDHCTSETIGMVLGAGYWAGITISPAKTSIAELETIVAGHPECIDRVMLNTDSGSKFFDDLYRFREGTPLTEEAVEKITLKNAASFFGI